MSTRPYFPEPAPNYKITGNADDRFNDDTDDLGACYFRMHAAEIFDAVRSLSIPAVLAAIKSG
jgi:hypothetical protein